jgi:hypothetical protein
MLKVFGNQEQRKEEFCRSHRPRKAWTEIFLFKTGRHNRTIQKSELKTKKQDRTIKESELKTNRHNWPIQKSNLRPRNRIGRLKNRNSKRTDTIGRYKNRNLISTDCIVRYNRKIESASEYRSIGPFAHLCSSHPPPPSQPGLWRHFDVLRPPPVDLLNGHAHEVPRGLVWKRRPSWPTFSFTVFWLKV